jgi:hypothetical protein
MKSWSGSLQVNGEGGCRRSVLVLRGPLRAADRLRRLGSCDVLAPSDLVHRENHRATADSFSIGDLSGRPLPGLVIGADEDLVDGYPPLSRDDLGDRVRDVLRPQRLDAMHLLTGSVTRGVAEMVDEFGVHRAWLDHAHSYPLHQQSIA